MTKEMNTSEDKENQVRKVKRENKGKITNRKTKRNIDIATWP